MSKGILCDFNFTIMRADKPLMQIHWDVSNRYVYVDVLGDDTKLPFTEQVTHAQLFKYIEARCSVWHRSDCAWILHKHNIAAYDPYVIMRITHCSNFNDSIWFKFDDENDICWADIDAIRQPYMRAP